MVKLSQKAREERQRQDKEHTLVDLRILGQAPLCKSKSLVDLRKVCMEKEVLGEGLIMEGENILKKIRTCHQCHRPINDPVHEGIQSGVGVCTLDHWGDCFGGIKEGKDAKNKVWAACPDETSDDSTLSQISLDDDDDDVHKKNSDEEVEITEKAATDLMTDSELESEDEAAREELRLRTEEVQKLQEEVKKKSLEGIEKAKGEKKVKRRQQVALEKAELERKADILRAQVAGFSAPGATSAAQVLGTSTGTITKDLSKKVAEQEARQQRRAAEKLAKRQQQQQQAAGLSMERIRAQSDVRQNVEEYVNHLKNLAPTLASDKTATGFTVNTVQPSDTGREGAALTTKPMYVYVAELGDIVPVVETLADMRQSRGPSANGVKSSGADSVEDDSDGDDECSADEDCTMEPEAGYRLAWRKYSNGDKYFVPVKSSRIEERKKMYILNESTGRYECQLVPVTRPMVDKTSKKSHKTKKSSSRCAEPITVHAEPEFKTTGLDQSWLE